MIYKQKHLCVFIALSWLVTALPMASASVVEDIQQLSEYSQEAQKAAVRLFDAGPQTLSVAHPILDDADQPLKLIIQLITIVGEIGDPASVPHIVNASRNFPNNAHIVHNAFMVLARIPQTDDSLSFAQESLKPDRGLHAKRSALWFYAAHRDERGREAAEHILADSKAHDLHDTALLLLGRLGDNNAVEPITIMLRAGQTPGVEYNLMMALAEIAPVDKFVNVTSKLNTTSRTYHSALRRVRFNRAADSERLAVATEMLDSKFLEEKQVAIGYMVQSGNTQKLDRYIKPNMAGKKHPMATVIQSVAMRQGYAIAIEADAVEFKKIGDK